MAISRNQYLCLLSIVFIQSSTITIAKPIQYESNDSRSMATTVSHDHHDDTVYSNENNIGEAYDDEEGDGEEEDSSDIHPSSITHSQNITSHLNQKNPIETYDDETNLYQDEDENDEKEETPMYGDRRSVYRIGLNPPTMDSNPKIMTESPTTSRTSFASDNLWSDLFSKPAILVGITGGIIIGMLSAILLVMFIIYRMRKKDEGSYVLEEAPGKPPSHAYTRVSSREFFA